MDAKMVRPRIVEKPWGHEEWWAHTDRYVAKVLYVRHGHRLSLQYHRVKDETMRVLSGTATFILGDETLVLQPGDTVHVPPTTLHRLEARDGDVQVVEVSTPEVEDVVRVQDDYRR
jgi:mannose-6-phosphate isomerase-like protein (cupin superfamily)